MPDVKVYGPYQHRGSFRCYFITSAGSRSWCPSGDTREAALRHAADAVEGYRGQAPLTIGSLVERYREHQVLNGRAGSTVTATAVKLTLLLGPISNLLAASLTPARAKARYREIVPECAAASHHEALSKARSLWGWAIEEGMLKTNPWTSVRKVGQANRGKEQLTVDEGATLAKVCLTDAEVSDAALAILLLLFCGIRSSEIFKRVVRDVDAGGARLLIKQAKTPKGKRSVDIPDMLRSAVRARTNGREAADVLLPNQRGGPRRSKWLHDNLKIYCELAGVPSVVPHALRGGWASYAYGSGTASHAVAAALGHVSPRTTEAHYASADSVRSAEQAERLRNLMPKDPP